ncbi:MAG: MarR family transcriptional regulator [Anaerolineales bacterium]|jgi:DNA-binding transcriptional regulator GbsR (MarR family)|nr:MarR family transcriptional regulator [Anaerolineales bacterium]
MAELTPVMKQFILHWGEMGSNWGLNRTVAQIHAMLYLSPAPLTAEEISETLGIARSTVSTGLRELQNWGVVRVVHQLGDRRDHFETIADIWEMFRVILRERKRREIDPAVAVLRESMTGVQGESENAYVIERLEEMLEFFEVVTSVYNQVEQLPTATLRRIARLGDSFSRLLSLAAQSERQPTPEM